MFLSKSHINENLFKGIENYKTPEFDLTYFKETNNIHDLCKIYLPFKPKIDINARQTVAVLGDMTIKQEDIQYINEQNMVIYAHTNDTNCKKTMCVLDEHMAMNVLYHSRNVPDVDYIIIVNNRANANLQNLILYCYLHYVKSPFKDKLLLLSSETYQKQYKECGNTRYTASFWSVLIGKNLALKHTSLFGISHDPIYEYMIYQKWCCSTFMFGRIKPTIVEPEFVPEPVVTPKPPKDAPKITIEMEKVQKKIANAQIELRTNKRRIDEIDTSPQKKFLLTEKRKLKLRNIAIGQEIQNFKLKLSQLARTQ